MRILRAFGSTRKILLVGLGVALLAIPVMEGKPSKSVTTLCTLTGDVDSYGPVEVGAKTWVYVLRDPATGGMTPLLLRGNLLLDWDTGASYVSEQVGATLVEGDYFGQARVGDRFDFDFGPLVNGQPCATPAYEDEKPWGVPGTDNAHLCPFHLVVVDGDYDRTLDRVVYGPDSRVYLFDSSQGVSCEDYPDDPDCIGPPDYYQVGSGPLSVPPWEGPGPLVAQFHDDDGGGETGPEKTAAACSDEKDNDGDGLIDCADPNCKKWCR